MANAHLAAGLGVTHDNRGSVGFGFNEIVALHLHDGMPGCERSQIGRVSRICGDCWNLVFKIPNLAFGKALFLCIRFSREEAGRIGTALGQCYPPLTRFR
ncbi:hypothetical protein I5G39_000355 [Pseudomonas aeruginosa]